VERGCLSGGFRFRSRRQFRSFRKSTREADARLADGHGEAGAARGEPRDPHARLEPPHNGRGVVRLACRSPDPPTRRYIRDPRGVYDVPLLDSYSGDRLPDHAVDTGYRLGGRELWSAARRRAVYVVTDDGAERWPRARRPLGCA
jgi:hypothetical protein